MTTSSERTPLLRADSAASHWANDSSFTRYAAGTAVSAPAVGASDPSHDHHGPEGRKSGDEKISRSTLAVVLTGLWLSNFTFAVQTSAVPTLAPRISTSFEHSELASYLGSIFPLFSTAFTPVYGVLLDTVGRKWAMGVAGFLFGLGTLGCGLSPSMGYIIAARAIAGAGGAGLLTVSSVITTDLTSLRDRGYYQGLMMIVFGLGASLGGPVAGWIADRFSWQWAFHAQLPFLLASVLIICIYLPTPEEQTARPTFRKTLFDFDTIGTLILLGSISSLLLGFSNHTAGLYPWSDPRVWGLLTGSGISLIIFIAYEGSLAKNPIVPLHLFKGQTLPCLFLSNFTLSIAAQTFLFHIPVFFTLVLKTSSATAGAHLLPNSIGLAIGSILAGQIIRQTGKYTKLSAIGLAMPILGIYSATKWSNSTPEWAYWAAIFPSGLGYSIFLCCGLVALIATVDPVLMPKATSLLYTFRSLGTTVGIALSSSLQQAVYVKDLRNVLPDTADKESIIGNILHSHSVIDALPPLLRAQVEGCLKHSLSITFLAGSIAAFVCLLTSLPIREKTLDNREEKVKTPDYGSAAREAEVV